MWWGSQLTHPLVLGSILSSWPRHKKKTGSQNELII
jgi:hypothetical protein